MKRLLVVEPDVALGHLLQSRSERIARATVCRDFISARARLLASPPDLLVTNLRLDEYNGLHLVLLASSGAGTTRSIVHSDRPDPYLIREARSIGAFFEQTERLPYSLAGYLSFELPHKDRRHSDRYDRRSAFRGGRRSADVAIPA